MAVTDRIPPKPSPSHEKLIFGIFVILVIVASFMAHAGADLTAESEKQDSKEEIKQVEISIKEDASVTISQSAIGVASPAPLKVKAQVESVILEPILYVYPLTKVLIEPQSDSKTKKTTAINYVAIADGRLGESYPLYEAYYSYGKSDREPWQYYWRVTNYDIKQGKFVECLFADFSTRSVKYVYLTPLEWDYVKKDIDAGFVPDINVMKSYWGVT